MAEYPNKKDTDIHEQLLRTIKYTGQTNTALINLIAAQEKQGRIRMLFWILPIVFMIFFYAKQHIDQNNQFDDSGYVAQVILKGEIRMDSPTSGADSIIPALRQAFSDEKAKGVVLRISSPGGSPTQSILIHDELKKLQSEYPDKKFVVVGEEGLTSGAYWIAAAAKEIHVLPATFTGSIGVIFSFLDISKLADRFDVKRRIITAGENKHRIDMMIEPRDEDIEKINDLASQIHNQFIKVVTDSRGDRLKGDPKQLFSGDFWLGEQALKLGLVDSVTSTTALLNEKFGTENVKDYSRKPGFFDSIKPSNPLAYNALEGIRNFLTSNQSITVN
ncbi:S49 family peptidase [Thalassotalea piscium]|uniref:Protease-4 n=1 Tax=Thalassotalea piscium TaxID=1230533 RepID=A0A7X0NJX3_9GAMM|nr:S49 family peptidase [Thalassotalea piscium]MBB6544748.1 protease-4 [Thalassotalea piscium]